ncbi:aminodeoxychorismate/anthranilate synthase component II [Bosea sp. BK604]|uniref:anthranilate synthase component II n=1 Tax=Bosea sp. BK604 TaxID=2512180 RepID=UPI001048B236|nr:aminodeoxychorismate/anthranilate synthase component II [Bosea sp. BK604]TCR62737.1 anthranilate synthase component 2 [Bosea sp. BK604]
MRVLLIDNYDSFTWNLVHLIGGLGAEVEVQRNDALSAEDALGGEHDAIVLSPGPCTPNEAGICLDVVREGASRKPIFGVCLGLQAIGQAFGGEIIRAPLPMHGKISTVTHRARGLFHGINGPIQATRYHSLAVARESCPTDLEIEAATDDGVIMALSHRELPVHGVQFHPESIASEHGATILRNFLDLSERWSKAHSRPDTAERNDVAPNQ